MIASVSRLFGVERTFERPREGLVERLRLADRRRPRTGTVRPIAVTRDLRSNARTLPGINCGTFQTDNAAQGSSLTA